MQEFFKQNFKGDRLIWIVFVSLIILSALEMFSASSTLAYKYSDYTIPVWRHVVFLGIGFVIAFLVHMMNYKYFIWAAYLLYPVCGLLLLVTLIMGVSLNGGARWLDFAGIQFQPSELAKLATITALAYSLSIHQKENEPSDEGFKWYMILIGVPAILIFPENFSTSMLLILVGFVMMYVGRVSYKLLGKTVGYGALALVLFFGIILLIPDDSPQETPAEARVEQKRDKSPLHRVSVWKGRMIHFFDEGDVLDESFEITKENYQVSHAKMAIANSRGHGLLPGNSIERDFLPQAYSDFIFAIIVEEMGVFGVILVFALYLILLFRVGVLVPRCGTAFPAFLVMGLAVMIVCQAYVNIAVALNLIPVTGQPLPMVSRGGTSVIITSVYFGMILSVSRYVEEEMDAYAKKNAPRTVKEEASSASKEVAVDENKTVEAEEDAEDGRGRKVYRVKVKV